MPPFLNALRSKTSDKQSPENGTSPTGKKHKKTKKRPASEDNNHKKTAIKQVVPKRQSKKSKQMENTIPVNNVQPQTEKVGPKGRAPAKKRKRVEKPSQNGNSNDESGSDTESSENGDTLPTRLIYNGKEIEIGYVNGIPVKKSDADRVAKMRQRIIETSLPMSEHDMALIIGNDVNC